MYNIMVYDISEFAKQINTNKKINMYFCLIFNC